MFFKAQNKPFISSFPAQPVFLVDTSKKQADMADAAGSSSKGGLMAAAVLNIGLMAGAFLFRGRGKAKTFTVDDFYLPVPRREFETIFESPYADGLVLDWMNSLHAAQAVILKLRRDLKKLPPADRRDARKVHPEWWGLCCLAADFLRHYQAHMKMVLDPKVPVSERLMEANVHCGYITRNFRVPVYGAMRDIGVQGYLRSKTQHEKEAFEDTVNDLLRCLKNMDIMLENTTHWDFFGSDALLENGEMRKPRARPGAKGYTPPSPPAQPPQPPATNRTSTPTTTPAATSPPSPVASSRSHSTSTTPSQEGPIKGLRRSPRVLARDPQVRARRMRALDEAERSARQKQKTYHEKMARIRTIRDQT